MNSVPEPELGNRQNAEKTSAPGPEAPPVGRGGRIFRATATSSMAAQSNNSPLKPCPSINRLSGKEAPSFADRLLGQGGEKRR